MVYTPETAGEGGYGGYDEESYPDIGYGRRGPVFPAPLAGAGLEAFKEKTRAGAGELRESMRMTRAQRENVMDTLVRGPRPEAWSRMGGGSRFGAGLPAEYPMSQEGQHRQRVMEAHANFIKTHPPGSADYKTYRQNLIDSGMFASDHVLAGKRAYTPGADEPMTLPDVLRIMYNVPRGQEIARDDIPGRAKQAGIDARRRVKSEAQIEVMKHPMFQGDMTKYNSWWHSLEPDLRPTNWEDARDAINLASVGERSGTGGASGGWGPEDPGALHYKHPGDLNLATGLPEYAVSGPRETLMGLASGQIPESFAQAMPKPLLSTEQMQEQRWTTEQRDFTAQVDHFDELMTAGADYEQALQESGVSEIRDRLFTFVHARSTGMSKKDALAQAGLQPFHLRFSQRLPDVREWTKQSQRGELSVGPYSQLRDEPVAPGMEFGPTPVEPEMEFGPRQMVEFGTPTIGY